MLGNPRGVQEKYTERVLPVPGISSWVRSTLDSIDAGFLVGYRGDVLSTWGASFQKFRVVFPDP